MSAMLLSFAYFRVNLTGCCGEFHVVLKHFQNLKNLILNILKEKSLTLWAFFSLKPYKTFRIAQCNGHD